jgi:hypothetical protein
MAWADASIPELLCRFGDTYHLPDLERMPIPDDLVLQIANARGATVDEVLELDYIDLLSGIAESRVKAEAALLRLHVIAVGRTDLLKTLRAVRDESGTTRHLRVVRRVGDPDD